MSGLWADSQYFEGGPQGRKFVAWHAVADPIGGGNGVGSGRGWSRG